jgi:hypothetical protein
MRGFATGSPSGLIEAAWASNLNQIRWLLSLQALPSEHIGTAALRGFRVCRDKVGTIRSLPGIFSLNPSLW